MNEHFLMVNWEKSRSGLVLFQSIHIRTFRVTVKCEVFFRILRIKRIVKFIWNTTIKQYHCLWSVFKKIVMGNIFREHEQSSVKKQVKIAETLKRYYYFSIGLIFNTILLAGKFILIESFLKTRNLKLNGIDRNRKLRKMKIISFFANLYRFSFFWSFVAKCLFCHSVIHFGDVLSLINNN